MTEKKKTNFLQRTVESALKQHDQKSPQNSSEFTHKQQTKRLISTAECRPIHGKVIQLIAGKISRKILIKQEEKTAP